MQSIIDNIFRDTGRCRNSSCKFTARRRGFKSAGVDPFGIRYAKAHNAFDLLINENKAR